MRTSTARVIVLAEDRLVTTLNTDHLAAELDDGTWLRVGGGCEPGESPVACARREAREELSIDVSLFSSPVTYRSDGDGVDHVSWPEEPAPFACEERDGYSGVVFLGRVAQEPHPGGDVVALLLLALRDWPLLECAPTVAEVQAAGALLIEARPVRPETRLWVHPDEALRVLAPLVVRHREAFRA